MKLTSARLITWSISMSTQTRGGKPVSSVPHGARAVGEAAGSRVRDTQLEFVKLGPGHVAHGKDSHIVVPGETQDRALNGFRRPGRGGAPDLVVDFNTPTFQRHHTTRKPLVFHPINDRIQVAESNGTSPK